MSIKISFMYYMKWTRIMLPVLFGEFEVVHILCYFFLFTIIVDLRKVKFSKNVGDCSPPASLPQFVRAGVFIHHWEMLLQIIIEVGPQGNQKISCFENSLEKLHDPVQC